MTLCGGSSVAEQAVHQPCGGSIPTPPLQFNADWRRRCRVRPATVYELDWCIRAHYLGRWPGVCVLKLALECDGRIVGAIIYALPPRETCKRYGGEAWELARLWISDDLPQNAETYLIGQSIRHIRQHFPNVKVLVSYADPSVGHSGTVYRAANWTRDGRTDEGRKTPRCDYRDPDTGKKYSRKAHVPAGVIVERVPRVSKHRFIYRLAK